MLKDSSRFSLGFLNFCEDFLDFEDFVRFFGFLGIFFRFSYKSVRDFRSGLTLGKFYECKQGISRWLKGQLSLGCCLVSLSYDYPQKNEF